MYIQKGRLIDARREAEGLLAVGHAQDISQWSNEQLDPLMNAVGQALAFLREEDEKNFYEHIGQTAERI